MQNVTVRRSASGDECALARLAALDSASPPRGPALIAEADSRMLAACRWARAARSRIPSSRPPSSCAARAAPEPDGGGAERAARRRGLRSLLRGRLSHA